MKTCEFDLDLVLNELGGQFGLFHLINFTLVGITLWVSAFSSLGYVFAASNLEYRSLLIYQYQQIFKTSVSLFKMSHKRM